MLQKTDKTFAKEKFWNPELLIYKKNIESGNLNISTFITYKMIFNNKIVNFYFDIRK